MSEEKPREFESFEWIEVTAGLKHEIPPKMIKLSKLNDWKEKQPPDIDLYSSVFRFNVPDPYVGACLAGLLLDFDCRDNPSRAQKEALSTVKYLRDKFGIPESQIRICFSGSKGFHVIVNRRTFDIEPSNDLPLILKSMAEELKQNLGLKTLDFKIYHRRALFRLENTRHPKTGLYKIPLTLSELESLKFEEIKAKAVKPRYLPTPDSKTFKVIPEARNWYLKHVEKLKHWKQERLEEFKDEKLIQLDGHPPCISKLMETGVTEGMRNNSCFTLARYFAKAGLSFEQVLSHVLAFNQRCDPPLDKKEVEATVKSAFEGIKEKRYSIGCSSVPLPDFCDREKCPFFTKTRGSSVFTPEIIEKANFILQNYDPLDFIVEVVHQIHAGDDDAIKLAYVSALSAKLAPSLMETINLWGIGTSGKGKSHLMYSVLQVLPKEYYEIFTSTSPKAFFYFVKEYGENSLADILLFIDEIEASKEALPVLRTLTTKTEITPRHLSVYDSELLDLKIKGKRAVWFTSVRTFGTEQLKNRFVFFNPEEDQDQDERVFQLQDELALEELEADTEAFEVAKAVTKVIAEKTKNLKVFVPFYIDWPFKSRRWLYPLFLSMIKIIAKCRFKQRKINENGYLVAEQADFELAKQLWKTFEKTIIFRVSKTAEKVFNTLPDNPEQALTHAEIAEKTGFSTRYVSDLCAELLNEGLINARKRTREGPGRNAWEYWKAKTPSIEDIKAIRPRDFDEFRKQIETRRMSWRRFVPQRDSCIFGTRSEPDKISEKISEDTGIQFQKCSEAEYEREFEQDFMYYRRVPPAERCPLCGKFAVEFEIQDVDGSILRRCETCFKEMQSRGFKLKEAPS